MRTAYFCIVCLLLMVGLGCEEQNDPGIEKVTEKANAIVDGGTNIPSILPHTSLANLHGCTGLLVAPRLVLTANHCGMASTAGFYLNAGGSQKEEIPMIDRHSWKESDLTDLVLFVLERQPTYAQPYSNFVDPDMGSTLDGDKIYMLGFDGGNHVYAGGNATTNVYRLKRLDYRFSYDFNDPLPTTSSEGGDSGAPLFDENGKLIGVHTGTGAVYVGHTTDAGDQMYVDWIKDLTSVEQWLVDNPGHDAWACLFEHAYFSGTYTCYGAGSEIDYVGSGWNDKFSSIKLFGHAQAKVFEHGYFEGDSLVVTEDIDWLGGSLGLNDEISALVVPPVVCFYDLSNWEDNICSDLCAPSACCGLLKYCTTFLDGVKTNLSNVPPSLVEDGYESDHLNDKISSIEIIGDTGDTLVDICKNTNLGGKCLQFDSTVALSSIDWSDGTNAYDSISSIAISHKPYGCFYEHTGYGGRSLCIATQNNQIMDWLGDYGFNDVISSFEKISYESNEFLPADYQSVSLYENSYYNGKELELTASKSSNLRYPDNSVAYDDASSIKLFW